MGKKSKSKITVVFDGYPKVSVQKLDEADINIVFSKEETADTRIKRMVEASKNPKNIVVVEWADRISKIMPKDTIWITFQFINRAQPIYGLSEGEDENKVLIAYKNRRKIRIKFK